MSASTGWQHAVEIHPPEWRFPAGHSWIAGWIYAGEHRFVADVRAWIDGRAFLGLPGLPKPGLDEKFLGRPGPPYSGFVFRVEPHRGLRRGFGGRRRPQRRRQCVELAMSTRLWY